MQLFSNVYSNNNSFFEQHFWTVTDILVLSWPSLFEIQKQNSIFLFQKQNSVFFFQKLFFSSFGSLLWSFFCSIVHLIFLYCIILILSIYLLAFRQFSFFFFHLLIPSFTLHNSHFNLPIPFNLSEVSSIPFRVQQFSLLSKFHIFFLHSASLWKSEPLLSKPKFSFWNFAKIIRKYISKSTHSNSKIWIKWILRSFWSM